MEKFIIKLIIISIVPLFILIYFEVKLDKIPNGYNLKRKYFEEQLDSIEVLVLGASKALVGIDPSFFSSYGFNLANTTQSIYYDTRLTLKYFNRLPKLKCIIMDIGYSTIGFQLKDSPQQWRDYFYVSEWGLENDKVNKMDLKLFSKYFLYTPEISIKILFNNYKIEILPSKKGYENNGYSSNYITDEMGKKGADYDNIYFKDENIIENCNDLKNFIKNLKKRNIRLVMITSPVTSHYLKFLDKKNLQKCSNIIHKLSNEFNIFYKDYSNDTRFQDSCFSDCVHLNKNGARVFSKIIDKEILTSNRILHNNYSN